MQSSGGKSWDYQYPLTTNWLLNHHHHHHHQQSYQHLTPGTRYATVQLPLGLVNRHHRNCPGLQGKHTFALVSQNKEQRTTSQFSQPVYPRGKIKARRIANKMRNLQCLVRHGWLLLSTLHLAPSTCHRPELLTVRGKVVSCPPEAREIVTS